MSAMLDRYVAHRAGKVEAHGRLRDAASALKAGLGDLRVDQVNQAQWDRYATHRVTRPRPRQSGHVPVPVSPGTLKREFNVLRAALRLAWKEDILPKPPALEAPRDSAPRNRYLTKEEAARLVAAAETPHVKVFLALALFTGARKGSILALTWDRVDFTTGTIDFQEPGRKLTAKRRATVPMNGQLLKAVTEAKAAADGPYVVHYNGKAVPTGLRWSWKKLCERAKLDWRPTPHHLKHTAASWLAMARVPIDQASDLLATDASTIKRVYRKFDPSYLRSAVAALEI